MAEFPLGVWSHNLKDFGSEDEMKTRVAELADAGFNLIVPCVKNPPGAVDFFTDVGIVHPDYPDWDPLKVLIEAARSHGMDVHAWFCVFAERGEFGLLKDHPEYAATNDESPGWSCGCRPEVQDYVLSLFRSAAERYKPAGLHLDYMRTGGACRCDYCREQVGALGVDVDEAKQGTAEYDQWVEWRVGRVANFVKEMRDLTDELGCELSAAVFGGYPECIYSQAQDWVLWGERGWVDALFPMNYTQSPRVAWGRAVAHVAQVAGAVPVWEGICKRAGRFSHLTPRELTGQMRKVLQVGADGIIIFSYGSLKAEDYAAIKALKGE